MELAKKLVKCGVVLDTAKYWCKTLSTVNTPGEWVVVSKQETLDQGIDPHRWTDAYIPAPSIEELITHIIKEGEMIELIYCETCGAVLVKEKVVQHDHDSGKIDADVSGCPACNADFSEPYAFESLKGSG